MICALRLWLRRSSALVALPALIGVAIVVVAARSGWQYEWGWALSNATTPTLLLSPALAGLVAFDRSRRFAPSFELLGATTARQGQWPLALAAWLWGMAAWSLAVGYAVFRVVQQDVPGSPNLWVLLEGAVAMLAAVATGLAWGARFHGLTGPPILAALIFLTSTVLTGTFALPSPFAAGRATGTLIGVREAPSVTAMVIVTNAAICLIAGLWSMRATRLRRPTATALRASASAALVLAVLVYGQATKGENTYEAKAEAHVCIGSSPAVCGPPDGRVVLGIAQRSLAEATHTLRGSGIDWRDRYDLARGADVFTLPDSAGLLHLSPENIQDGAMSSEDIAATLAMPRLCRAFFDADAPRLLEDQGRVLEWARGALNAGAPAGPAPQQVIDSYRNLSECDPATQAAS